MLVTLSEQGAFLGQPPRTNPRHEQLMGALSTDALTFAAWQQRVPDIKYGEVSYLLSLRRIVRAGELRHYRYSRA